MIHGIPVIGTLLLFVVSFCMAIPFWFIWNSLAGTYFYFLPSVWKDIPFWHVVGLFMLLPIFKSIIQSLTPRFVYVSSTSESKTE